ncbi:MAG: zinc-binding dehydrogenase [Solirubrobacterales bacterium]|nr:zinc-binding dehydrogenase [Solirubrobacterales bacterium]MBV9714963.1 zinc-binding dehydrogenase [Solirubrobacterales bacterium]
MPATRCVVLEAFGAPVVLREVEADGAGPEPGEIVAAVEYGGVCGTDVHLQAGRLPIPLPLVLGHEGVGRASALGPGVDRDALGATLAAGDRIAWASNIACGVCPYCRDEQEPTLCERRRIYGINRPLGQPPHLTGSWAERIRLEAGTTVVRLAEDQPPAAVIALGCAGPTAVHGLLHIAPVRPGESVVVQGAGPVGLAAAMYAQLAGARPVIVIGAPAARLRLAEELAVGDEQLDIDELDVDERLARVRELTRERGGDLVVECTGAPAAVSEALDLARPGGRVLVLGQYTDHGPTPLNPHLITRKQLTLLGSWAFSAGHFVEYLRTLPQLRARFPLERLVTRFPLERAQAAIDAARAGEVGKAVLAP